MIRRQVVAAMIGLAFCTAGVSGSFTPAFAQLNRDVGDLTIDEHFARIAEQVPEFGGLFVDDDEETLVVNVTQDTPEVLTAVRRAIATEFPNEDFPRQMRLEEVPFAFASLQHWKESATALFETAGVVALDIDEQANRLTIGIANAAFRADITHELDALSIPADAWELKTMAAPTPQTSLQDKHSPIVGGLEIGFDSSFCTAGFIATRSGLTGFVTNSHCTSVQGGVTGTTYTQPDDGVSFIGAEIADPAYFTGGGCPAQCGATPPVPLGDMSVGPCKCRYSDSAFVKNQQTVTFPRRFSRNIAFPAVNEVAWNGFSLPVVSEGSAVVGQSLRKVGRTTGHTTGKVTETCVDLRQFGSRIIMKCQTTSDALGDGGDSGSPVFAQKLCLNGGGGSFSPCAQLYGILWGVARDTDTGEFLYSVFSPISNIQKSGELGPLSNCTGTSPAC